ncbi:hypothetical protein DHD08_13565 [Arenibacter sp. H213]|nr:hypothetical protein [Arenibacter sp. H213]
MYFDSIDARGKITVVDSEIRFADFSFFLELWLKLTKNKSVLITTKTENILKKVTIKHAI